MKRIPKYLKEMSNCLGDDYCLKTAWPQLPIFYRDLKKGYDLELICFQRDQNQYTGKFSVWSWSCVDTDHARATDIVETFRFEKKTIEEIKEEMEKVALRYL